MAETVLVCRPSALEPLQSLLKSYKPPSKTVLEIVKEDADDEDENDTLSALSAALPKLPSHGHVAVLPCDIATDLPFSKVVDGLLEYSAKEGSPAVSVLAYEASKVEKSGAAVERGHDKDPGAICEPPLPYFYQLTFHLEPDMLAYTSKGSLALFRPHDPDRSTFVVSPVLLSQTQNLTVSTEFRDAHVYLFANWAVRWLAERGKKEGWTNVRKGVAELVKAGWKPADWLKARGLDKHGG